MLFVEWNADDLRGDIDVSLEEPLIAWHAYMVRQTDLMFEEAGGPGSAVRGGSARGVVWPPFAPQYIRKTDGVVVPAWGGVPKLRGKGMVKPRKRPSGQPVTPASLLVQDTGRLRQRAATEVVEVSPASLVFGTRLEYAPYQQELRPYLFVTDEDADILAEMVADYLTGGENAE